MSDFTNDQKGQMIDAAIATARLAMQRALNGRPRLSLSEAESIFWIEMGREYCARAFPSMASATGLGNPPSAAR